MALRQVRNDRTVTFCLTAPPPAAWFRVPLTRRVDAPLLLPKEVAMSLKRPYVLK